MRRRTARRSALAVAWSWSSFSRPPDTRRAAGRYGVSDPDRSHTRRRIVLDIPADLMTRTNDELNAWFDGVRRDSPEDVPDAIAALSEVYAPAVRPGSSCWTGTAVTPTRAAPVATLAVSSLDLTARCCPRAPASGGRGIGWHFRRRPGRRAPGFGSIGPCLGPMGWPRYGYGRACWKYRFSSSSRPWIRCMRSRASSIEIPRAIAISSVVAPSCTA